MTKLILYFALALGVSFLCSLLEASLLSVTPSFARALEREGRRVGKRLRALKDDIDRPLAAILSLNTIAHTAGAAGAGAEAARVFGDVYLGLASAILTFLILVLSEIIPKTIGAVYWKQLTGFTSAVLPPMIWLLWPLVWLSQKLTRLLSRDRRHETVSRAELEAFADLGRDQGVFERGESRILRGLFRLRALTARDVMTPRTVMFSHPERLTIGELLGAAESLRFSRIPIYAQDVDDVTGYVLKDDLLQQSAAGHDDSRLEELRRPILKVPETISLPDLFDRFLERREHIAIVYDEHGGVVGLVTLEDGVETLLGQEIVDEADTVEDMQELARRRWAERAQRLGLSVDLDVEDGSDEEQRRAALRLGLPGGPPPRLRR